SSYEYVQEAAQQRQLTALREAPDRQALHLAAIRFRSVDDLRSAKPVSQAIEHEVAQRLEVIYEMIGQNVAGHSAGSRHGPAPALQSLPQQEQLRQVLEPMEQDEDPPALAPVARGHEFAGVEADSFLGVPVIQKMIEVDQHAKTEG